MALLYVAIGAAVLCGRGLQQIYSYHVTFRRWLLRMCAQDEVTADELALSEALSLPFSAAFDFSSSEA